MEALGQRLSSVTIVWMGDENQYHPNFATWTLEDTHKWRGEGWAPDSHWS